MAATFANVPSMSCCMASRTVYSCTPILSALCWVAKENLLPKMLAAVSVVKVVLKNSRRFIPIEFPRSLVPRTLRSCVQQLVSNILQYIYRAFHADFARENWILILYA